jgi:hypothetical protein
MEARALHHLKAADRICFVELDLKRAVAMSDAMDDILGRTKVTVAKGPFIESIKMAIRSDLDNLDTKDSGAGKLAERIHKAISDDSRSTDIGMAGRLLKEFIVAHLLFPEDTKKMTPFEITQELRKLLVAEWVISYLNLLHAFGNETVHHRTKNTYPSEIEGYDLAACLLAMQRTLDFWSGWKSKKSSKT